MNKNRLSKFNLPFVFTNTLEYSCSVTTHECGSEVVGGSHGAGSPPLTTQQNNGICVAVLATIKSKVDRFT